MPTPFTPSPSTFNNATTPMSHNIEAACVSHYAHVGHGELVVLFVFSSLIMGTLLEWTMHKVPLPHTSVLLIAGFFIGLIVNNSEDPESILGQFGKGTNETAKINPHLLLFIFLPPLIFHSAFSIHWHVFKKVFSQVMTLALPGLSMAMVLTGISMKWMYPSWSWSSSRRSPSFTNRGRRRIVVERWDRCRLFQYIFRDDTMWRRSCLAFNGRFYIFKKSHRWSVGRFIFWLFQCLDHWQKF